MGDFDWNHGFSTMDQKNGVSWVAALGDTFTVILELF
jgi:hypothetical protein